MAGGCSRRRPARDARSEGYRKQSPSEHSTRSGFQGDTQHSHDSSESPTGSGPQTVWHICVTGIAGIPSSGMKGVRPSPHRGKSLGICET
jgi:hypothetical protein